MAHSGDNKQSIVERRPDPEELLTRYHLRDSEPLEQRRGHLRVYLGAAAGVGKTYTMLNEGHRRKMGGADVVVGFVETHGRVQTQAQIGDLEVIPRQKLSYRGLPLEEMDTQAIIQRHPQVALIDELAHTNAPGSRNPKRYQDVEEIQNAGIDVITTVNVQHLESLNDLVTSITGIRVRETLPDHILDQAEEVELVDIAPQALQQRLKQGYIYPPDRVELALHHFFREGNLMALRELSLRLTTQKTEKQLQEYMLEHKINNTWSATERVMVGFDDRPQSQRVIRDAWRLAHGLDADLIAVHVELEGYPALLHRFTTFLRYGAQSAAYLENKRQRLEEHARLAEDLGAEIICTRGQNIGIVLVQIAREYHITQMVLGQPALPLWEEFLRGSVINRVLRLSSEMDIHLVPLRRTTARQAGQ